MNQDRRRRLEKKKEDWRRRRKASKGEEGKPAVEKKTGEEGRPAKEKKENRQWRTRLEEKEDRATEAGHRLQIERQPSKTGTLKQDFSRQSVSQSTPLLQLLSQRTSASQSVYATTTDAVTVSRQTFDIAANGDRDRRSSVFDITAIGGRDRQPSAFDIAAIGGRDRQPSVILSVRITNGGCDRQPSVVVSVRHHRHDRGAVTVSRQAFDIAAIGGCDRQPSIFVGADIAVTVVGP
jgi:hypothetical protein